MAHRNFDAGRTRVDTKVKGPSFVLADQEFTCLPKMPAGGMQRIALAVRVNANGDQVYDAPNVIRFITDALIERRWIEAEKADPENPEDPGGKWEAADDRERFRAVCEGTTDIIDIEELGGVMEWIIEEYQGRPT